MDVEKAGGYAKANDGSHPVSHEGVGDPFTYRGRTGAFTASEWAFQIVVPILVVLLGASSRQSAHLTTSRIRKENDKHCLRTFPGRQQEILAGFPLPSCKM